ncbi:MAG TPA: sulfate ABC transporter permease subunit CysT [Gammaproteobacteria bacterium]|nr:sulfate ABC transporter permease subunit CysT [Gammaproteobacteria bacterium]
MSAAATPLQVGLREARVRRPLVDGVLPGGRLAAGITIGWLGAIVLLPVAAVILASQPLDAAGFLAVSLEPRVLASYRLTFGMSLAAAAIDLVAGVLIAWVLVRYHFPGRRLLDTLVDLPFALPTAVAGIALGNLYAPNGWLGAPLAALGIEVAFKPLGVLVALTFIGLPFVVRTVQPVLVEIAAELEEVAATLGATRWQTFRHVVLPAILPAALTGFTLAFARAVGEYGSVIFVTGNIPYVSEITPLVIISRLEEYDYRGAAVVGATMLIFSFAILFVINALQAWGQRRSGLPG